MTGTTPVAVGVEQAFLRCDPSGSVTLVAASFDDAAAEEGWTDLLAAHLTPTSPDDTSSSHALSYLVLPEDRAIVFRRGAGDGVHALLGHPAELTPAVALGLASWPHWWDEAADGPRMVRVGVAELHRAPDSTHLRQRALGQGNLLARTLAWLLQTPTQPLAVIGCPEQDRVALLWGLLEIAASQLARSLLDVLDPRQSRQGGWRGGPRRAGDRLSRTVPEHRHHAQDARRPDPRPRGEPAERVPRQHARVPL
jgi:hypothetical protein